MPARKPQSLVEQIGSWVAAALGRAPKPVPAYARVSSRPAQLPREQRDPR